METTQSPILWPILAGLLIILANAFFVTFEIAIVTIRRGQMERLAQEGNTNAKLVLRMLRDPEWAIAGTQVGITIASILVGIVAEDPLSRLLSPVLLRLFKLAPFVGGLSGVLASLLTLLILSFFLIVLGEMTPKTIALRYPVQVALWVVRPVTLFARIVMPLVWLVDHATALALRTLGIGDQPVSHGIHTVEELKEVVRESRAEGVIPADDHKMLLRALEFSGRFVREAMIPRTDIVAIEKSATLAELLQTFKTSRHARFPVYEGDLDHVCGVVVMKDVLSLLADGLCDVEHPLADLGLIKPALVAPESRRIGDLFNQMRRERKQMAVVIDEFGGTAGLVTAEELAEEVVGRLIDDWVTEPPAVAPVGSGFEVDAQNQVDEVNEALNLDLPTSPDYETVAGFLLFQVRRIPRVGDQIAYGSLRFTVLAMSGRKIERVRVERV